MFVLTDSQQVVFGFQAVSAAGNPAPVEHVSVQSSDESIVQVAELEDGLFRAVATGKLGVAQLTARADALIGEGEEWIYGVTEIQVIAGRAVKIEMVFDTPEDKPVDPDYPPSSSAA